MYSEGDGKGAGRQPIAYWLALPIVGQIPVS